MNIEVCTNNPFEENTYILYDQTGEAAIIDCGCYTIFEEQKFSSIIEEKNLKPVLLLCTHMHIDHILGNAFMYKQYGLSAQCNEKDSYLLDNVYAYATAFGFTLEENPPKPGHYLNEGDIVSFGNTKLSVLEIPGHSPGSLGFYNSEDKSIFVGDVLFNGSIGRSDFPGGNYEELLNSINKKLLSLGDDVVVYPGHGPSTSIGFERCNNAYLK